MKPCQRCGDNRVTQHHVHPLCHFGTRRTNQHTIPLCEKHHREIEIIILAVESRIGGVKYGQRFKLHASEYENIVRQFQKKKYL